MPQPDRIVEIKLEPSTGLPVPEDDPIEVKLGDQRVKWVANFPFTIDIKDFTNYEHGKESGNGRHNCVTGYFGEKRKHKYSITANGKTNDPELDIKP